MTRFARAFWIVAAGMFLLIVGPGIQDLLSRLVGVDLDVLKQGVPLLSLIGLAIFACGIVQVGLAAWRTYRQ